MKKIIAVLAFALMLSGLVHAGQYEDGWEAYDKGNYQQAYKLWQTLAEQGNAKAQVGLALMYRLGKGVTQDDKQATDWLKKLLSKAMHGRNIVLVICTVKVKV